MPTQELMSSTLSCSLASRSANEQLCGTAPQTLYWLLLEYPYPVGEKAFEESHIPAPVKEYLSNVIKSVRHSRLLIIRRPGTGKPKGINLFVCISSETNPQLYQIHLSSYEEILSLDIYNIWKERPQLNLWLRTTPLFLVCTNGKRDPCCARLGLPLYSQMTSYAGTTVWQTSHVGGHRFAPNVILLPPGIYYGRVETNQCQRLIETSQNRSVLLDILRGRSCYPPEVQVAEYFLRRETGIIQIEAFTLLSKQQIDTYQWLIFFRSLLNHSVYNVHIRSTNSDFEVFESCKTPDQRSKRIQYHLVSWGKNTYSGE